MTSERWQQIESLFAQAVECPLPERQQFLDGACGGDDDLRRELESLLASDAPEQRLIEVPSTLGASPSDNLDSGPDMTGRRIGPYRLIRLIGHGGMGAVYLGVRDDDHYQKQVAIKLLKRGMDTDFMLSRFRQERQILANLEHPFIARLLDGGATEEGLPYLVMEYVDGVPITKYCAEKNLSVAERLQLFRLVCEAVQYAHQNLVVHRDIKPGNILTTKEGIPKLLDFGIAKVLDPELTSGATLTQREFRMLTPDYASPEQVRGSRISTASDTYSLGAVLYELLSGERPHRFTSNSLAEMERSICEVEPEKPSSAAARNEGMPPGERKHLARQLSGDLDNIVLTAMRKEPPRRYPSAADFSEDLRRHLEGLPILAEEDRWTYRAGKFIGRNKLGVAAALLIAISLIGGIVATVIQARRAERRFQEVRTLAHSFLFEVHDQIETLPGSTRARELMVQTVLRYLNNLARESSDDPSLQWELATAYQKIGDVQGYGFRPNLGQPAASMESQTKALVIAEQLAARGYDPKVQRLLALAHHRIAVLMDGSQTAAGAGIDHYHRSLELLERLNRESPGDEENSSLLIMVYGHLGDAQLLRGRPAEAAASWQRTLEIATQWANSSNQTDVARLALGAAHRRVSRAAQLTGDLQKAFLHARNAIEIHEPLAAKQPASTALQRELLNSYERLAYVAADPESLSLDDRPTAMAYNSKVTAIAESLAKADPHNSMAESDLIIAKRDNCAYAPDDDAALVVRVCEDAVAAANRRGRNVVGVQPTAALRLGPALVKARRHDEAVKTMERAIQLLTEATQSAPWRTDLRLQLVRVHNRFGAVLLDTGKRREALDHYLSGLAIAEQFAVTRPEDLVLRRDLADCYLSLGRYYENSDLKEAAAWYSKELKIWSEWPRQAPSSILDQKRLDEATRNVARCAQG